MPPPTEYMCVEWLYDDPNAVRDFSVEDKMHLVDGSLRCARNEVLIGKEVMILWRRREHRGKILNIGTKKDMERETEQRCAQEYLHSQSKRTPSREDSIKPQGRRGRLQSRQENIKDVLQKLKKSKTKPVQIKEEAEDYIDGRHDESSRQSSDDGNTKTDNEERQEQELPRDENSDNDEHQRESKRSRKRPSRFSEDSDDDGKGVQTKRKAKMDTSSVSKDESTKRKKDRSVATPPVKRHELATPPVKRHVLATPPLTPKSSSDDISSPEPGPTKRIVKQLEPFETTIVPIKPTTMGLKDQQSELTKTRETMKVHKIATKSTTRERSPSAGCSSSEEDVPTKNKRDQGHGKKQVTSKTYSSDTQDLVIDTDDRSTQNTIFSTTSMATTTTTVSLNSFSRTTSHDYNDDDSQTVRRKDSYNEELDRVQDMYNKMVAKYQRLRTRYLEIKNKYNILMASGAEDKKVELIEGSGVLIGKTELTKITSASKDGPALARMLFRSLFTQEQLASHSLFGVKCNANSTQDILPEIDPTKRTYIFEYVNKIFGPNDGDHEQHKLTRTLQREVKKSVSDFLRETRRRLIKKNLRTLSV